VLWCGVPFVGFSALICYRVKVTAGAEIIAIPVEERRKPECDFPVSLSAGFTFFSRITFIVLLSPSSS